MIAQSIMTENPACCTVSTPLRDVAKMMIEFDCGEIPVISGDGSRKPVGVITDRDIATRIVAQGFNPQEFLARDCMTTPCVTVNCGTSLKDVCELMEVTQIRRVPVIDGNGDICGIVSLADIARAATPILTAGVVKEVSATN